MAQPPEDGRARDILERGSSNLTSDLSSQITLVIVIGESPVPLATFMEAVV
jgi:hypothetical protein